MITSSTNENNIIIITLIFLITVHVRVFISNKNAPMYALIATMSVLISASFSFLKIQIISNIKEIMMNSRLCASSLVIYTPLEFDMNFT